MPTISELPEKLVLHPVQPVPLPKNWHFSYSYVPGWSPPSKARVLLFYGPPTGSAITRQDEPGQSGFNALTTDLLFYAASHNLWGKTLSLYAVATDMLGISFIARSATVRLAMPVAPCKVSHHLNMASFESLGPPVGNLGDPVAPVGLAAPNGRRLYHTSTPPWGPSVLGQSWYVGPDNRIEENSAYRGCDRFTFWLGVYGVCLKHGMGVCSGETLALRLNAQKSRFAPYSGTLGNFVASSSGVGSNYLRTLLWTATRVVVVDSFNLGAKQCAYEFDTGGLHKTPLATWLVQENAAAVWNFRDILGVTNPIYGQAGLP